jgi:hypothetical protein
MNSETKADENNQNQPVSAPKQIRRNINKYMLCSLTKNFFRFDLVLLEFSNKLFLFPDSTAEKTESGNFVGEI